MFFLNSSRNHRSKTLLVISYHKYISSTCYSFFPGLKSYLSIAILLFPTANPMWFQFPFFFNLANRCHNSSNPMWQLLTWMGGIVLSFLQTLFSLRSVPNMKFLNISHGLPLHCSQSYFQIPSRDNVYQLTPCISISQYLISSASQNPIVKRFELEKLVR